MEHQLFNELAIIISIAAAVSLLMRLLKQPLIIGYIITGLLVGPTVFNLVRSSEALTTFSDIGISLLLFLVGLGLNPKVIKEVGRIAVLTGVGQVLFTTSIGYLIVTSITDISNTGSLYVAIALAFSSTIIVLKLLSDKKEQNRLHGKIATGFLLVQDILATFALVIVSSNTSGELSGSDLILLVAKGILLGIILLSITRLILPKLTNLIEGSQEILFMFSISWGLGVGAIFKLTGFSLEVGALAAGVCLAGFSYAQESASRLKPLRDFFIVLFFVILGSQLDLSGMISVLPQAIILSLFVIIGNPLIVMTIMGLMGYTKKTSFKTSLAVAQISEFSLVLLLLATRTGQVDSNTLQLVTVVGLITIAVSSYAILYDEKIFPVLERYLSIFEMSKIKEAKNKQKQNEMLLFGYKKGGLEFVKVFKQIGLKFAVIDYDPEVIENLENNNIDYIYGDITDLELLEESGIANAKLIVSVVNDSKTNKFLLRTIENINPKAVFISTADSVDDAIQLYSMGAGYVMLPHYIGSEKISSFIKKNGFKKSEFNKFRNKHIEHIKSHLIE